MINIWDLRSGPLNGSLRHEIQSRHWQSGDVCCGRCFFEGKRRFQARGGRCVSACLLCWRLIYKRTKTIKFEQRLGQIDSRLSGEAQIRMNANIQQEWQINLGQGWALMLWTGREHRGACWGNTHTHTHALAKSVLNPQGLKAVYVHAVVCIICVHDWPLIIHQLQWSIFKSWSACYFNRQFRAAITKRSKHPMCFGFF